MKKIATILTVLALFGSNVAHAQSNKAVGSGAQSAQTYTSDNFAWGIGLGALVVVGVVVGVTAAAACSNSSSYSH